MARFTLYGEQPETGRCARFFYDNETSELLHENSIPVVPVSEIETPQAIQEVHKASVHQVSKAQPGIKTEVSSDIRTLKIQLGLGCNYSCEYCNQRVGLEDAGSGLAREAEIQSFMSELPNWFSGGKNRDENGDGEETTIEFWGGEPLVYWKTLLPMAQELRARFPRATFKIISNGSLLTPDIVDWLDRLGFYVGISHDGPGQAVRGPDPLMNPASRAAILALYQRLHPQGRFSFNAMVHRGNQSRAAINQFFVELTGDATVVIGEGSVIDPYDASGLRYSFQTDAEAIAFRRAAFNEIRHRKVPNMALVEQRVNEIVQSIAKRRPAITLGQKCGMDRPDAVAVDLHGNVLTCQNTSFQSRAPNGESHRIGHVSDFKGIRLTTATHWAHRDECNRCPVLQSCKGSCMFLEGALWEAACDNAFADQVPFFVMALEHLTGYVVFYIEGPQRASRQDLFGLVGLHQGETTLQTT